MIVESVLAENLTHVEQVLLQNALPSFPRAGYVAGAKHFSREVRESNQGECDERGFLPHVDVLHICRLQLQNACSRRTCKLLTNTGDFTNYGSRLVNFPDFRADRNIRLREGLVHANADLFVTRYEKIEALKPSPDYRPIGSPQFELVARFQARTVSHSKWHRWSKMQGSILKLECLFNHDELGHGAVILSHC